MRPAQPRGAGTRDDSDVESVVSGPGALNAVHESTSTRTTRQTVDLTQQSVAESFGEGQARNASTGRLMKVSVVLEDGGCCLGWASVPMVSWSICSLGGRQGDGNDHSQDRIQVLEFWPRAS